MAIIRKGIKCWAVIKTRWWVMGRIARRLIVRHRTMMTRMILGTIIIMIQGSLEKIKGVLRPKIETTRLTYNKLYRAARASTHIWTQFIESMVKNSWMEWLKRRKLFSGRLIPTRDQCWILIGHHQKFRGQVWLCSRVLLKTCKSSTLKLSLVPKYSLAW